MFASKRNWKIQRAVHVSDTPVILTQGHQTCYELVDLNHGYKHVRFERPHFNSVGQKANLKVFVK